MPRKEVRQQILKKVSNTPLTAFPALATIPLVLLDLVPSLGSTGYLVTSTLDWVIVRFLAVEYSVGLQITESQGAIYDHRGICSAWRSSCRL